MLILLKTPLETLNYFVEEMAAKNPDAIVLDATTEGYYTEIANLVPQMDEETAVVVFNGAGRRLEYSDKRNIWEEKGVRLYNILVDHPANYDHHLSLALPNETIIVVDRRHKEYINKYYPQIKNVYFLPHGGSRHGAAGDIPYEEREIPVIYCGSCQRHIENYAALPYLPNKGAEFYDFAQKQMIAAFSRDTAEIVGLYLKETGLALSRETEMNLILKAHIYVQNLVRRVFKINVMQALAEGGIPVEIYGANWEEAAAPYPSLLKLHERVSSAECVRLTANAKISLNIMPFFKDGSHERVYIAMLNKAVCVTDRSRYWEEKFVHGRDIVFFDNLKLDALCDDMRFLLNHPGEAVQIAENAYERVAHSRWSDRLETILRHDFDSPQIV
jgi:hypothetical protein